MMPLVSIIIPCYNYGQFIEETIDSVISQTYQNWEIIIADDGSEESTLEVLRRLDGKDHRIRILYLKNGGPSKARNTAIQNAKGRYILPLDADDKIGSTYLEKAVHILDKDSTIGIVYCDAEFFGKKKGKWHLPEYHFPAILLNNCIFVSAFFRREDWVTVSGFDESMRDEWEDYDFWLKIIKLGRGVYKIPETLFFYRRGHDSRTKKSGLEVLPLYRKLYTNHSDLYKENVMYFLEVIKRREIEIDNSFILLVKKLIKLVIRRLMGPIRKLLS